MKTSNLKCPKCGYTFEAETDCTKGSCPLCSSEYDVLEALKLYENSDKNQQLRVPEKKNKKKIIAEYIIFFSCFSAFIFVLYCILSYIVGK